MIDAYTGLPVSKRSKTNLVSRRLILQPDELAQTADAFICHARADAAAHPLFGPDIGSQRCPHTGSPQSADSRAPKRASEPTSGQVLKIAPAGPLLTYCSLVSPPVDQVSRCSLLSAHLVADAATRVPARHSDVSMHKPTNWPANWCRISRAPANRKNAQG